MTWDMIISFHKFLVQIFLSKSALDLKIDGNVNFDVLSYDRRYTFSIFLYWYWEAEFSVYNVKKFIKDVIIYRNDYFERYLEV